jgi:hypothetical protein
MRGLEISFPVICAVVDDLIFRRKLRESIQRKLNGKTNLKKKITRAAPRPPLHY